MKIPKEVKDGLDVLRRYADYEHIRTFEVILEKAFDPLCRIPQSLIKLPPYPIKHFEYLQPCSQCKSKWTGLFDVEGKLVCVECYDHSDKEANHGE